MFFIFPAVQMAVAFAFDKYYVESVIIILFDIPVSIFLHLSKKRNKRTVFWGEFPESPLSESIEFYIFIWVRRGWGDSVVW